MSVLAVKGPWMAIWIVLIFNFKRTMNELMLLLHASTLLLFLGYPFKFWYVLVQGFSGMPRWWKCWIWLRLGFLIRNPFVRRLEAWALSWRVRIWWCGTCMYLWLRLFARVWMQIALKITNRHLFQWIHAGWLTFLDILRTFNLYIHIYTHVGLYTMCQLLDDALKTWVARW